MQIIVGLGNPERKYLKNRHNCGYLALDMLAADLDLKNWHEENKLASLVIKEKDFLLAKPLTYMNKSGEAVQKILNYYKATPKNLTIIYDDIDLPLGKIRIREEGSAGTHNGMRSIIEMLGTKEFRRIRIGIDNRREKQKESQPLSDYVLSDFASSEMEPLKKSLEEAVEKLKNHLT